MDLDVNIEDIEFPDEEQRVQESKELAIEFTMKKLVFFEEESLTLHSAMFEKSTKKLVLEKVQPKVKKSQGKSNLEFDFNGVPPFGFVRLHEATREVLEIFVDEMENENSTLKDRIKELESALMPPLIFVSPIATMEP